MTQELIAEKSDLTLPDSRGGGMKQIDSLIDL